MSRFPSIGATGFDERAVIQTRIARFALIFALLALAIWVAAAIVYSSQGKSHQIWAASSIFHLVCVAALGGVWAFTRRGSHSRQTLLIVETIGVAVGAGAVALAALEIKLEQRPEMVLIFGLTQLLVLRAALVPSTARHTLAIGVMVGIVIVPLVYLRYYGEPEFLAHASIERSLAVVTAWTAIWWSLSVATTTMITKVIYGLRRDFRAAQQLGQYTLERRLGEGGMGEVWRATHGMLRRPAAIKLIRPAALSAGDEQTAAVIERFEREAQATASLESPHTVELYDFGISEDGVLYHVIELLRGCDLERLVLKFGALSAARVCYLLAQACDSLDDAHHVGLIHRDIKPANIFVAHKGRRFDYVKVLDFGLVKHRNATTEREGIIVGTPAFMAPETIRSRQIDGRADIYALGCVAFWLLTGKVLFDARDPKTIVRSQLTDVPPPPSQVSSLPVPPEVDQVVLACLEKDPANRPQSGLELAAHFEACTSAGSWTNREAQLWWEENLPDDRLPGTLEPTVEVSGPSRMIRPA